MAFVAIVKVEDDRPTKFQEFDNKADAEAHVAEYGGFVADNPPGNSFEWKMNGAKKLKKEKKLDKVEDTVTRYQFMVALAAAGELAQVEAAMHLRPDPTPATPSTNVMLYWLNSGTFHRKSEMAKFFDTEAFTAIADVDALFRVAGKVRQ